MVAVTSVSVDHTHSELSNFFPVTTPPRTNSVEHKEHFYVNRSARELLHDSDPAFLSLDIADPENQKRSELHANTITRALKAKLGAEAKPVLPAQFHGMKLLHALFHYVMDKTIAEKNPVFLQQVQSNCQQELSSDRVNAYLHEFAATFPPRPVFSGNRTAAMWLEHDANRQAVLEESFLVWMNEQNPALQAFAPLLTDKKLMRQEAFRKVVVAMRDSMRHMGDVPGSGEDLSELLMAPIRHAPGSILEQLRYIRLNWAHLLEGSGFLGLLGGAIGYIEDEDKYLFFENIASQEGGRQEGGMFEKGAQLPRYTIDDTNAPARYSVDSSWMPEVVMLAKSTYVWLDQLSKTYHRHISRLQDIPDEELDRLAERGFTALWLIGLWERSPASRKIKQLQGNPEAKASAYALENYEIAQDLGGYDGYMNLMQRARMRGIRLASDMVPNHTGMDSELVRHHPEWFLSASTPPYHNYSYTGPNLCDDLQYGIYLEDGYWNRSDAAVTFKRIDFRTNEATYIYHGNDGTNMPWNDTAQLDFLSPAVREVVIQQIIAVARMFPIIRFDAAMVLAKRHIQRLWYPLHGQAGGVPSRSAYAMSNEEFDAAIPEEFWREVVDRIKAEVPDTLLLAEAFWMLEGYFVRTLGMHRVYNSAFMHMLKKEDNAEYRNLIKITLEFDPEILKRYVNFMNNPDEDTAIAQFGRGDKYFGVCMMMLTLPGLPMFGHGQVEGFTEKYGMEYAKAYYDEQPDDELVGRHYREIFPIMKKRPLFAEVSNFFLYDLFGGDGHVNENVFAYSNRRGHETALVVYNNCYERASGTIHRSAGYRSEGAIRQSSLVEGLLLSGEHGSFVLFREHTSGLEFIRSYRELADWGLFIALDGYRYNLFTDFYEVKSTALLPYDRLAALLDGRGVPSVREEALRLSLAPLHDLLAASLREEFPAEDTAAFTATLTLLLDDAATICSTLFAREVVVPQALVTDTAARYAAGIELGASLQQSGAPRKLLVAAGLDGESPTALFATIFREFLMLDALQQLLGSTPILEGTIIDGLLIAPVLVKHSMVSGLPGVGTEQLPDLYAVLLAISELDGRDEGMPACSWLQERLLHLRSVCGDHLARFMLLEERHGREWFREHRFSLLLTWMMLLEMVAEGEPAVDEWIAASEELDMVAFLAGYELNELLRQKNSTAC